MGELITYTIEVTAPRSYEIRFQEPEDQDAGLEINKSGSSVNGLFTKTHRAWYMMSTFKPAAYTLKGHTVRFRKKDSETWQKTTLPDIDITVTSLLQATEGTPLLKDIKPPLSLRDLSYIYIILAIAALIIALIIYFMLRKKKYAGEPIIVPPPPHETALESLKVLMEKDYITSGRVQEFYVELSDIVRHYLEDRFYFKAPEMTTEEFLVHLKNAHQLKPAHKGLLSEFLVQCDMVKFAKHQPGEDEIRSSYDSAEHLVVETGAKGRGED